MTEQQPYDLVRSENGFDVRHYPEHVVVETVTSGDFEGAGSRAFRYLFGYITGDNAARGTIEMTAPVVQAASQRIAMTAPVVQSAEGDSFVVAFVLPASLTEATAPRPSRPEVSLRTVPARYAAAARFSGRWSEASFEKHRSDLLSAVEAAGLSTVGKPWFARFDPPFTPWFLRHNEVLVEIATPG
ncbi:MAG: heme-binding protein [Actinobacteria bacterium]|nr:heme-binding protein [Actinomycetota bacterium]